MTAPAPGRAVVPNARLVREVSLPMLVLYGLGTTIGAGIYALTGEVVGSAGSRAPLAFLLAAVLAGTTAIGFAELAGRLPKAAGEAVFVEHAFRSRALTRSVGVCVMAAGVIAAAAICKAFGGYVADLVDVPPRLLVLGLIVLLAGIAISGAKESVRAAALFTVIEIVGLGLVLWAGRSSAGDAVRHAGDLIGPPGDLDGWAGVFGGAFLAFFAFLGFEDIDSVAEETHDAPVTLPRAILLTLAITGLLYMTVSAVAATVVDPGALGRSDAPLALVYGEAGGNPDILRVIAALAMVNGALVQLVMIPRVAYGLSNLGLMPTWIGRVSPRTHTPTRATAISAIVVMVLATTVDLGPLARLTSAATLVVFITINAALIAIKRRDGPAPTFQVPRWTPYAAIGASGLMLVAEVARLAGLT